MADGKEWEKTDIADGDDKHGASLCNAAEDRNTPETHDSVSLPGGRLRPWGAPRAPKRTYTIINTPRGLGPPRGGGVASTLCLVCGRQEGGE